MNTEDLVDSAEVGALLGLANHRAVSVYKRRYTDFPPAAVHKGACILWVRADIEAWLERHPRRHG